MRDILSDGLMVIGAVFLLLAAVGVLRMPDLFTRMQPATKAATLGMTCTLLAAALHFRDFAVSTRAVATIFFFLLTAPVTAHLIARASYVVGVPLWSGTRIDELRGRFDRPEQELTGAPEPDEQPAR